MLNSNTTMPPGQALPYILRQGQGRSLVVAGQVIRVLAGTAETAGGFGAVVCEATLDRQPIPLHYHEREHDTWFCTRGRLQIWSEGVSRMLTEGDFAYVRPGDVHSYQSIAPRTQFFGVVGPGGWEGFFDSAGSIWEQPGLPPENHPFDFSRMGVSMQRYRVMRADSASFVELSSGNDTDRILPEGPQSFFLQAGYGKRRRLNGHLSTQILSLQNSTGMLDMRTIEAGEKAAMPGIVHPSSHVTFYVLEGGLNLRLNNERHDLHVGDFANIPAGTVYSTCVNSGTARWLVTTANGNGMQFWNELGTETEEFTFINDANDQLAWNTALRVRDWEDLSVTD